MVAEEGGFDGVTRDEGKKADVRRGKEDVGVVEVEGIGWRIEKRKSYLKTTPTGASWKPGRSSETEK